MRLLAPFLLLTVAAAAQNSFPAIGGWREHLPYGSAIDLAVTPDRIYTATPYSLFSVDRATGEMTRFSKVGGLSETGISTIAYDGGSEKLFVGYSNSNIDVLTNNGIRNIPDLLREQVSGDKTIYDFFPFGTSCYVSTGLGVWVLDAERYETKDSWFIGAGGAYVPTYMVTRDNSYFYAATAEGLKRTPVTNPTPSDFRSWQNLSGSGGLSASPCKGVVNTGGRIVAWQNDSLFVQNGSSWSLFYSNGYPIVHINGTDDKLALTQSFLNGGPTHALVLNPDGSIFRSATQAPPLSFPQHARLAGSTLWVADRYAGLSAWGGGAPEFFKPNGPEGLASGNLTAYNGVVYAAAGTVNASWNYQYNRDGIYQFKDGSWTNYNQFRLPALDTVLDMLDVAVDPRDESFWGASYGGGLVHYTGANSFTIYKQNSPIGPTIGDPTSYRVSGLAFDASGNLWIANYGAANFLHVLKADGSWVSFAPPFALNENAIAYPVVDDEGTLWAISPKGNGLIAFNPGSDLDNRNDDAWRLLRSGAGNGNLPLGEPLCLAKDRSGYIWLGTTDGIAIIQCGSGVFRNCEAVLPIVKGENNFANYLFKGEEVRSIAVDGADRKWVATRNGLWLISPDGDARLQHFTEENSPLLSNDVQRLAIDGASGEVFVSTAKGVCSFRGSASSGADDYSSLQVFPNPVPPGYSGPIAIRGLREGSIVKITELNGRLVFQARSLGGHAVWNGSDYRGKGISSGVYLVLVTDGGQQEHAAGKIVFIAR
ncbi:ligand-binding sensor domain-containing protein [Flaviaesturariibacter terrae]